jgi:putative ABC transport system permease protein
MNTRLAARLYKRSHGLRVDFRLASRAILRQKRRSLTGIAAIAFGIVALVLAAGFIEWIYVAMREDTIRSGLGHIQVFRAGFMQSGLADPFAFILPDNAPERQNLEQVPGVASVAPRLMFSGLVSLGEATLSFTAEGVMPQKEGDLNSWATVVAGQSLSADAPLEIVMGQGLAANLGAKVGDRVVLLASTKSGGVNAVEATVRGTFSTISKAYDDSALRAPLPLAQRLLRVSGAHKWVILLQTTDQTRAAVPAVKARLGTDRLEVVPWYDLADFYNKTVVLFQRQISVMKLIIAVIIILSVSNTMMMSVMERVGEIGTALALGVKRRRVMRRFLCEGVVLGLVGGMVGLALGIVLAHAISSVGIPMPPPPGTGRGFTGRILVTWRLGLDAVALAVVTTLLAGIYPAWKASRMVIVDALRHGR